MEGIGNPKLVQSDIFLLLEPLTLMEGSQATRRGEAAPATGALALMGGSQAAKTASVVRYRTSHNGSKGPYPLAADSLKSFRRGHPVLVQKVSGMSPSEGGISPLFDHWTGAPGVVQLDGRHSWRVRPGITCFKPRVDYCHFRLW